MDPKRKACIAIILAFGSKKRLKRKRWVKDWLLQKEKFSHLNLMDEILLSDPHDYKNYFRMSNDNFNKLLDMVSPYILKQNTAMRASIMPIEKLAVTLRFYATGRSFEDLKFSAILSPAAISQAVLDTSVAIMYVLQDYVKNLKQLPVGYYSDRVDSLIEIPGIMAVCVAVIGKENWPVYVACSEAEAEMQWRVHTALDVAEERLSSGRAPDQRDLYLGLLYSTEAHNIYGYVTNTRVKLFAVVGEGGARDAEVRSLLRRLHALYADALCCPFYRPGDAITSPIFDKKVRTLMAGGNI